MSGDEDALADNIFGAGDARVAGDGVAQGPIEGRIGWIDADPRSRHGLLHRESIIANLEAGAGRGEIEAVVAGADDGERLAEAAGARRELRGEAAGQGTGPVKAAVADHLLDSRDWLQGTNEHATGLAFGFAGDVHAEVAAVDGVDVGVTGVAEEDFVARSGATMGVGSGVDGVVVGAKVGFDLDDAAGDYALIGLVNQDLAEQAGGDEGGEVFEELPGEEFAGKRL